jgi:hypothetical protein
MTFGCSRHQRWKVIYMESVVIIDIKEYIDYIEVVLKTTGFPFL